MLHADSAIDSDDSLGLDVLFDGSPTTPVQPTTTIPTPSVSPPSSTSPPSTVITKQTLLQIREHIEQTIRPVWQAHLPDNFGDAEHGKLKADQWRTALEFDIPVSLIQIANNRKPSGNIEDDFRLQKIAEHTLDLAMALCWCLSRRTSKFHGDKYMFYMTHYLKGIQDLYPHYDLKPIHHYALHIPEILDLFGPLHGTWGFFLERLIGCLQKMNTNSKIGNYEFLILHRLCTQPVPLGEIETSVMLTFCRRSNLIRTVEADDCPRVLKEAWDTFCSRIGIPDLELGVSQSQHPPPSAHGLCSKASTQSLLDPDIYDALVATLAHRCKPLRSISKEAHLYHYYTHNSVQYSDFRTSNRHSLVYFVDATMTMQNHMESLPKIRPGQIRTIFQHSRIHDRIITEEFVAIHPYIPAVLEKDPFSAFKDFRAGIFNAEPSYQVVVVPASHIHCHANQRPWNSSSVVMRAIDRVSFITSNVLSDPTNSTLIELLNLI